MIITICGSMVFTEEMLKTQKELEDSGHKVYISGFAESYLGKSAKEIEEVGRKDKMYNDAIMDHCEKINKSEAILVLNYDRKNIKNYIGGNTLMELGFAYVLKKKIFLLNPIPEIDYYQTEIEAVKPIVINGDFKKIKL